MKNETRLLLATDFSDGSQRAMERVLQLTHLHPKVLLLVHVLSAPLLEGLQRLVGGHLDDRLKSDARQRLQEAALRFNVMVGTRVETRLEVGRPHAVIARLAEETGSLIVLGTHGPHPIKDWLQGSLLERILCSSQQSLLVVRRPASAPYRRILVAVDFSPCSAAVIEAARRLQPQAELVLLHAFTVPLEHKLRLAGIRETELDEYRRLCMQQAENNLKQLTADWPGPVLLERGHAPEVILEVADREGCDLIVMGRNGQSGIGQLLVGSVTEYVTATSDGDVMVIGV